MNRQNARLWSIRLATCVLATGIALTTQVRGQDTSDRKGPQLPAIPPTYADIKYGPHDRNLMDVWLANSDTPTPVVVSIHGGGFRRGDKSVGRGVLRECLNHGISVVAITYRYSSEAIAPAQHRDAARAIQFIRHKAADWNIDPARLAAIGGSAGAGLSLWLGFHDDMADVDNDDPVLRHSTRLTCMAVSNGQSSYDPRFIRELIPEADTYRESALAQLFGVDLSRLDHLPEEKYRLFEEVSAIHHLTQDDAPVLMTYSVEMDTPIINSSIGIHHPRFGKVLQERMHAIGIECQVETGVSRTGGRATDLTVAFLKRHLKQPVAVEENVTYGIADDMELKLDLARPAGEGPFPAILFIHGGGWYAGDRQGYRSEIEEAATRGYVAATISYRLMQFDEAEKETTSATTIFPAQVHDAKAAVRFLRANSTKYRIDPMRIGVTGRSAGGHLSLMLGLADEEAMLEGDSGNSGFSSRVQAVVNVFGPTEMAGCYRSSSVAWIFRLLMGGKPDETAATYTAASPVTYASRDDPPVLTIHGDRDLLVPFSQATTLDETLKSAGASHTLIVFEGQGHGFRGEFRTKELNAMWDFFDEHLKR